MSTPTPDSTVISEVTLFGFPLEIIFEIAIIAIIAIVLERIVTRYLTRFGKRTRLEPHVANNLALTFRILVLVGSLLAISRVSGSSFEWIVSFSAIGAAAVGFASQKTIGNFVAGIFLISARPFRVGNYVRLGSVEGIVTEITINYTKVLTASSNVVSISNLQILDREITNFLFETREDDSLYCYTFDLGFDHLVPSDRITAIFNEVFDETTGVPRRPIVVFTRSTAVERVYTVYIYVNNPKNIFELRPRLAQQVFQRWDQERSMIIKK